MNVSAKTIADFLGRDPYTTEVHEIRELIGSLTHKGRIRLLSTTERYLRSRHARTCEQSRVCAVKVLVSLLPHSSDIIRRWLQEGDRTGAHEILFTLFCFLDHVRGFEDAADFAREVPGLVERFLLNVSRDTGRAAWMAGDLLDDHWDLRAGILSLTRVIREARYVAGRAGALHGLGQALLRTTGRNRERIIKVLQDVEQQDRSSVMRSKARWVLDYMGTGRLALPANW